MATPLLCSDAPSTHNTFIAVHFGTTFSGFAAALGRDSEEVFAQPQSGESKEPTAVLFDKGGEFYAFGKKARMKYFDLEEEEQKDWMYFDRFKMMLKNDQDVAAGQEIMADNKRKMAAKTVFAKSLKYFYNTAKTEIPRLTGADLKDNEIQWVLTVPAIWGDRAKVFMLEAAKEAGMAGEDGDNVEVALEPEAASICCRTHLATIHQRLGGPAKLRYIVVDCGGGTIDCTVQEVDMKTHKIRDIEAASGGSWGGTEIDKTIKQVIQRAIGPNVAKKIDDKHWLQFERVKIEDGKKIDAQGDGKVIFELTNELYQAILDAGGDLSKTTPLQVEGVEYRKKRNAIIFSADRIAECYRESINRIVLHTKMLFRRVGNIHCILMVGGFSECPLLLTAMEKEFNKPDQNLVIHPPKAGMAVVKGAVMYGQNPNLVESRVMKYSYGIEAFVPFKQGEHPVSKRLEWDGQEFCSKIFASFVKSGESVTIDSKVCKDVSAASSRQKTMRIQLYRSLKKDVKYTDEEGCDRVVVLCLEMPRVEFGKDRSVQVIIDFSRTTLKLFAKDNTSGITGNKTFVEL